MNNIKVWVRIVISLIILAVIGLVIFIVKWGMDLKYLMVQFLTFFVTGLGITIALLEYHNSIKSKTKNYLELFIKVSSDQIYHSINTQISNKSGEDKKINFSFLLISRQNESLKTIVDLILKSKHSPIKIKVLNELYLLKELFPISTFIDNALGVIPLNFYYDENYRIENESPTYTYTFDNNEIKLDKGIYSVRFFVFFNEKYLHRIACDSLIIK